MSAAIRFTIDHSRPLPDAGVPAFAATDTRDGRAGLMALPLSRTIPMRQAVIDTLTTAIDNLLLPVGQIVAPDADGRLTGYLITPAPPGPSLRSTPGGWSEPALLAQVLRPAARVLAALEARGVTHRAIRLGNMFLARPGGPVTLGTAWAEPPAMRQPAAYEPPYSAACHAVARGDGSIADDVYALGVVLIALALGREPMDGLDDDAILHRKLGHGSFQALVGDDRLPPAIADLTRNMLAEDPDHRPTPTLLLDPVAARGRRVAARPPRRAPRPLKVGRAVVWDARTLAFAIGRDPRAGLQAIHSGEAMHWLRRALGEPALAARLEELQRQRQADGATRDPRLDALTLMRAVVQIDPLAPLCWNGVSLWPDGLGGLLAAGVHGAPELAEAAAAVIETEAIVQWAMFRTDRADLGRLRGFAQRQRASLAIRGPGGGALRLLYALNPGLPCASPALASHWVARLGDLPPALDAVAPRVADTASLAEPHMLAFIAARGDRRLDAEIGALAAAREEGPRLVALLRLLTALQLRHWPAALPALAGWISARGAPLVAQWHYRPKREAVAAGLAALAPAGQLAPMLALVDDAVAQAQDSQGLAAARRDVQRIDAELARIAGAAEERLHLARRVGQEAVAGLGLAALAVTLVLAALG